MTLFVVAFSVIAVLALLLWLLVRPLANEPPALREEAAPSIFGAEDRAACSTALLTPMRPVPRHSRLKSVSVAWANGIRSSFESG
jgi:hypothetical protein